MSWDCQMPTFRVSSGSHSSNRRNRAHSVQRIRCFWFCCASLVEKVLLDMPGQSSSWSKFRRRRFVANRSPLSTKLGFETLEGSMDWFVLATDTGRDIAGAFSGLWTEKEILFVGVVCLLHKTIRRIQTATNKGS
jgi:hypothetical protein